MKLFETDKKESRKTRLKRLYFNFFPAYRNTGARVAFIASDYTEIHIKLRLYWRTKNYVGTVFGGSIFGALDPIYMVQLINILRKNYVVWDKEAKIKFLKNYFFLAQLSRKGTVLLKTRYPGVLSGSTQK